MPYAVEKQDDKYAVINTDSGEVMGTHATRAKADAQLKALYASEPEAGKSGSRNNKQDRFTIRAIRAQALALAELTRDLEPTDTDQADEPETDQALENFMSLIGDNTLKSSYSKSLGFDTPDLLAVKSIGADEIRGYSQLWGSEKLTDIEVEYFTKSTDFWDDKLGKTPRPLTWDHAQDTEFKASPVIGQIVDFGDDEVGRWYVARLDRAHRYRKAVDALIKAGKLGTSSDSAPQYVERVKTGKSTWLKTWPFFAAALTDQPCEPRMLTAGSLEYLKSIGIILPDAPLAWELEQLQNRVRLLKLKGA